MLQLTFRVAGELVTLSEQELRTTLDQRIWQCVQCSAYGLARAMRGKLRSGGIILPLCRDEIRPNAQSLESLILTLLAQPQAPRRPLTMRPPLPPRSYAVSLPLHD